MTHRMIPTTSDRSTTASYTRPCCSRLTQNLEKLALERGKLNPPAPDPDPEENSN